MSQRFDVTLADETQYLLVTDEHPPIHSIHSLVPTNGRTHVMELRVCPDSYLIVHGMNRSAASLKDGQSFGERLTSDPSRSQLQSAVIRVAERIGAKPGFADRFMHADNIDDCFSG